MESIRRILVAIDFSEQAERVAALGLALAKACGARLYLLHVIHDLQSSLLFPSRYRVGGRGGGADRSTAGGLKDLAAMPDGNPDNVL